MRRSLVYYWRINLAILLAAAVITAVLTGALLVEDSIQGSLTDLTLERLGGIDLSLRSQRFFRENLADDLRKVPDFTTYFEFIAPAIHLNGTAICTKSKIRATHIQIHGVDQRFERVFDYACPLPNANLLYEYLRQKPQKGLPSIVINEALQKKLQVKPGDPVLLYFEKPSDVHREFLLDHKKTKYVIAQLKGIVTRILPDRGVGRFSLSSNQRSPLNAFVALPVLQQATEQPNRVNTIYVAQNQSTRMQPLHELLQKWLDEVLTLDDLGLNLRAEKSFFSLESRALILKPWLVNKMQSIAAAIKAPILPVFTYLVSSIEANGQSIPYSTVTAINTFFNKNFGSLLLTQGAPAPPLFGQEILLNQWAAKVLKVTPGDSIELSYYVIGPSDRLQRARSKFVLRGVLAMKDLATDSRLAPLVPGIYGFRDISEWEPPFPVDFNKIGLREEKYWDKYGMAPKAFVSLATGQRLWGSRFGNITSLRIAAAPEISLRETREIFIRQLLDVITPAQINLIFYPVKYEGLMASTASTNLPLLYLGFNFLIIFSAAIVVGLLFSLNAFQRRQEIGLLLAVGYPIKIVRNQFFREGWILAFLGGLVGLALSLFYAWLIILGLRSWWAPAVGTPFLFLHVNKWSLIAGFIASFGIVFISMWLALRTLGKVPVPTLLHRVSTPTVQYKPYGFSRILAFIFTVISLGLLIYLLKTGFTASPKIFLGLSISLLVTALSFLALWLKSPKHVPEQRGRFTYLKMAIRNASLNPVRSLITTALVGTAWFVIVTFGAIRPHYGVEILRQDSGTGGFAMLAQSDIPVHFDLNDSLVQMELGFSKADRQLMQKLHITPLRLMPGEDVSCLNLYRPITPKILAINQELVERGRFQFKKISASQLHNGGSPWHLLQLTLEDGSIPAIGDYNSVVWTLHSGLDQEISVLNQFGEPIKLKFVGLLNDSIFQDAILISEKNFLRHFPDLGGCRYFLIDSPKAVRQSAQMMLEKKLSNYGFEVIPTTKKMAGFQAVENTYLSIFQTLTTLGLLLGILGLAILLIRTVIERQGELATLQAFGYRQETLALMVSAENIFLLLLGIGLGSIAGIIAVLPYLINDHIKVLWFSIVLTMLVICLVGIFILRVMGKLALRQSLVPALPKE